ncbi:uncharacterized protein LOC141721169 isoform X2 [Apium graveolens]|uniref:uncharacterized protein LOC141721169 isoform X2 n=1 Tax=Apium graveolens TaxID=4045 RepID=UPI003D7A72D8
MLVQISASPNSCHCPSCCQCISRLLYLLWSSLPELDIYIVKATNHVELPSKEKHIRGKWIFHSERLGKTLTPNVCARREC